MDEYEWLDIFVGNLESIMERERWSQTDLAKYLGISISKINKVLQRKQMPSVKMIVNLSHISGVTTDDLIYFDDLIE